MIVDSSVNHSRGSELALCGCTQLLHGSTFDGFVVPTACLHVLAFERRAAFSMKASSNCNGTELEATRAGFWHRSARDEGWDGATAAAVQRRADPRPALVFNSGL